MTLKTYSFLDVQAAISGRVERRGAIGPFRLQPDLHPVCVGKCPQ